MGFDDALVYLDNKHPDGSYFAGDVIKGRLKFQQNKVKTFRGIYAKLKGACDVHWTTSHTRTDGDGKKHHYTKNHNSHETYVDQKVYLIGGSNGEMHLNPGEHVFPFQIMIPPHCPSSYEGSHGHVRYHLKFIVDRSMKFDQEKTIEITVVAKRDLNADPYCKQPIEFEFSESYCCWCVSAGVCEIQIHVPASGYCPGQVFPITVNCANKSNVEIDTLKFEIKEEITFRATHEPDTRHEKKVIAKIKKGPVPENTTRNWTLEMEVPDMTVYNLDACQYIDIDYEFEVEVSTSGCHEDTSGTRRFIIGHVPLREFEYDPAPPADNPPQQNTTAPQHQAPFSYSQNTQYPPVVNEPHPGGTTLGYPGQNPYPGNFPHPSPNPAPGFGFPPAPGVNPPYPGGNSPYPGRTSPYPGGNPPYPGGAPYPGGNPYPGANPPYPSGMPPFPGSPNHPTGGPYPGYAMPVPDKDGATVPLLPAGAVPYPMSPGQGSPFATASAPVPSTPDSEGVTQIESTPAYNPDFKEDKKPDVPSPVNKPDGNQDKKPETH